MKKTWKKIACLLFSLLLLASTSITSLAFYQEPASKKGIPISSQDMISDILELGCKQVVCNLASYQSLE